MKSIIGTHWQILAAILVLLSSARDVAAQRNSRDPHLAYAFPAGCRQGTSCGIVLGGQYLKQVTGVHVTGTGVEAEVVGWYRPMTRGMYNNLRMKLNETRERLANQGRRPTAEEVALEAGVTADQLREMEIYRQRARDPKRQPNEQLEEELTIRLTVAEDAEPGKREFRVITETSMSNPIWLHIGMLPEVREKEPGNGDTEVIPDRLPLVINGQIMPGDVDRFTFHATRGTKLVIDAGARDVTPFLADAVPGWFQAVLTLEDSSGEQVAYADSFHFRQDPAILFEVPRDDRYTVTIRDSIYRGREDFVYRMTVGEVPFVTSIFPLGARVDSDVTVELEGWNLSQPTVQVKTESRRRFFRPVHWVSVPQDVGPPIRIPLQIDNLREELDREPNDSIADAQDVDMPRIINGRIDRPGDQDVFRIQGRGKLVVEVQARKHGSPLDSLLILVDEDGNEVAFNDDHEDKSQSLSTHHADSQLSATIPGAAPRYLIVTDARDKGGEEFVYRLYLRSPEPDYELRVVPSTIIASAGAVVPITVFALRKDGFEGDIQLRLTDPPVGFHLAGGLIPGNAESTRMTLTVPATATEAPVNLEMEGQSGGITRTAVPAEHMMQAFIWYHLVTVEDWNIIINRRRAPQAPFEIARYPKPVLIPLGGQFVVPARPLQANLDPRELRVELSEPPPGTTAEIATDAMGRFAVRIITDPEKAPPGWRGNLLLRAFREHTPPPTESNPAPSPVRTDYGFLPAFPVEFSKRARRN